MIHTFRILMIALTITCCTMIAKAEVEVTSGPAFTIDKTPKDIAVSANGEHIYVLTKEGDVLIYSPEGKLEDTVHVGKEIDFLAAGPSEDQLVVGSSKARSVRTLSLELIHKIDTVGEPFQGPVDAPVVIAVFMDYQCPYCARLYPLLKEILELNPGKVKIVYKQFPLKMHKAALSAASAALTAFREGKFQQMHDLMEAGYQSLSDETILDKAVSLGFNREEFRKEMADPEVLKHIQENIAEGKQNGVTGIPTVFINGRQLKKRSVEGIQEMIAQELGKSGL